MVRVVASAPVLIPATEAGPTPVLNGLVNSIVGRATVVQEQADTGEQRGGDGGEPMGLRIIGIAKG